MDLEFLIQRLERYLLEDSPKIPLSGNRAVSEDEIRTQLHQIREVVPKEMSQARDLVRRRDEFLDRARQEASQIIVDAQAEGGRMLSEHRLVKEAEQQAEAIQQKAHQDAAVLRAGADEYVFDILSQLQGDLTRLLRVVENGLRKLETEREQRLRG